MAVAAEETSTVCVIEPSPKLPGPKKALPGALPSPGSPKDPTLWHMTSGPPAWVVQPGTVVAAAQSSVQ